MGYVTITDERDEQIAKLRAEAAEMLDELHALRLYADGKRDWAFEAARRKIARQRAALDALTRRQTTCRFALRLMNRLREPVTAAEWATAREAVAGEQARDRIDKQVPGAA